MMKKALFSFVLVCLPLLAGAQTSAPAGSVEPAHATAKEKAMAEGTRGSYDISTNVFDWADLATINVDFGISVSRHLSLQAGLKYNPWKFEPSKGPITLVQNQQKSASIGVRYWPWYVFSGWWVCAKAQYCDYAETGVWRQAYDMGKALGAGLSAGYTLMINKHFNVEAGIGFWGGRLLEHTLYDCPNSCFNDNVPRESGPKNFIALNDLNVSLHWVF